MNESWWKLHKRCLTWSDSFSLKFIAINIFFHWNITKSTACLIIWDTVYIVRIVYYRIQWETSFGSNTSDANCTWHLLVQRWCYTFCSSFKQMSHCYIALHTPLTQRKCNFPPDSFHNFMNFSKLFKQNELFPTMKSFQFQQDLSLMCSGNSKSSFKRQQIILISANYWN